MKLIPANDALVFLAGEAPQAWVQRALQWMVLEGNLSLYAAKVTVTSSVSVFSVTRELYEEAGEFSGPKMDEAIRKNFSPELAEKLVGRNHHEDFEEDPHIVDNEEEIGSILSGFMMFSDGIDWTANELVSEYLDNQILSLESLFAYQDLMGSEFDDPTYTVKFSGLSFDTRQIELLLPNTRLETGANAIKQSVPPRAVGRPRKWDWDGVMAHIVACAQTPDGLPTGPGAQAKVEAIIADWFTAETGDAPSISQIRGRASRVMRMIEKDQ